MSIEIYELKEITDEVVEAFERLFPQLTGKMPAPQRAELEKLACSQSCRVFMARADGQIAGSATLGIYRTPTGVHTWIEDVVVDEAFRRRGIGEMLTRKLIETAYEAGADSLSLTSRPAREAANRLYQQMGFVRWETNLYHYPLQTAQASKQQG